MSKDEFEQLRVWDRFTHAGETYTVRRLIHGGVEANVRKGKPLKPFLLAQREAMSRAASDPPLWHAGRKQRLDDLGDVAPPPAKRRP